MACVGNDDDLRSVVLGEDGALAGMSEGAIFVDHTTVSAIVTRELAFQACEAGIGWVDAPVSGGQAGAENGQLVVMCGGAEDHFAAAEPGDRRLFQADRALRRGGFGPDHQDGQPDLHRGRDPVDLGGSLLRQDRRARRQEGRQPGVQGAGGSWQLANRADTMIDNHFDHGFAVDWMRKDLGIALEQGKEMGLSLPVTALVDQFYAEVQQLGGGRWDTSSLIQRFRRMHGEEI
jgi:3-hydroxyisobutyrate dehydrogenase